MSFFRESKVKGRKVHRCDACYTPIEIGGEHSYMAGTHEGDFWSARNHLECRAAEVGLAELHGLWGGEDWIFLYDLERDDLEWIEINHPVAYERVKERYVHD